ncbi:MAG: hypothetical protein MI810_01130, partial [Flavobacteriales bacterium]|nr:hypothetical protein [Flavobacteriales bacterium]
MREGKLYIIHKHHLRYEGNECLFDVMGALSMDISRLNVSLHLSSGGKHKHRLRLDLYNYADIQRICTQLSEEGDYSFSALESDLLTLTQLLEEHREGIFLQDYQAEQPRNNTKISLSLEKEKEIVAFLQQKNLLELLSDQVGEIGIVGEENNRLLLFLFGLSYKTSTPLHALVQSSSGSGKSHLINSVADCFPKEDVISFSRITGKSLYHYKKDTLKNKLILIQDFDGLDDEALYAFRELQSYGKLTSSSTGKDAFGNHIARLHTVEAHFASFGASTKSLYQDNASRSVILSIDESYEQSERIM